MKRRKFLKLAGAASAASLGPRAIAQTRRGVSIEVGLEPGASSPPLAVQWAADRLSAALVAKGASIHVVRNGQAPMSAFYVVVSQVGSALTGVERFRLEPWRFDGIPATLVSGSDELGTVYALLELAERVHYGSDAIMALHIPKPIEEKPANEIRCVSRYFSSEIEDKPWLYDKESWTGYLDLLAVCRFNRFCLAFGLEYDFPRGVTSDYLHFPYPYLVEVPGYNVRVMQLATPDGKPLASPVPLSAGERKKNLDALRFIAAQTAARGLHFQLGIWTHAYQWTDSPHAYHRVEGLTRETHAAYCRDALAIILKECPEIQGVSMRVHGESGIPEGSYEFWATLFDAVRSCGRAVEIDMHAKGVDQRMIDVAVKTGMPVSLGAKYSAEHQSLGYHQADIRALEIPKPEQFGSGPFSLSAGARSFTRYGYADFLKAGAPYKVLFRLWPGTQRHLLSADPEMAAAYGRTARFCRAAGIDLMEPLTFKGREGSGQTGGRCAYADATLNPKYDWEKFELFYRVWGRRLYDPGANPEAWRRWLRTGFGAGAAPTETAVANASRILALLTSAHLPSASNHSFWPELYTNMPIAAGGDSSPYSDTPEPKTFAAVSPLDPQMFSSVDEHAADLLAGNANPKYSPIEVAQWMEDFARAASAAIAEARVRAAARAHSAAFRRIEADVEIQIGLGRFFAGNLRSGVLLAIFEQSDEAQAGRLALDQYRLAREAWAAMAAHAAVVYQADISYGSIAIRRGAWKDRLAAIDRDMDAMAVRVKSVERGGEATQSTRQAIQAATRRPMRASIDCTHTPPAAFQPGAPLALSIAVSQSSAADTLASVILHYRHVNQAERWKQAEMQRDAAAFSAVIPAGYSQSPYALQYYFEFRGQNGTAWLHPAFNATLSNQPYYVIEDRSA